MMKVHQIRLILCKEGKPDNMQAAWANYDEKGSFINITNFYGSQLKVLKGNKVSINNEIWFIRGHISRFNFK